MNKRVLDKIVHNKEVIKRGSKIVVPVMLVGSIFLYTSGNLVNAEQRMLEAGTNIKRGIEYTSVSPQSLYIMEYAPIDYAQSMSYILSLGEDVINRMDLQGLTLEEHLFNLNYVCELEGVNATFMLAQQLIETGNFSFANGDTLSMVSPMDFNFGGLGATNSSRPQDVEKFKMNIHGQLAQAQHIKGYASTEDMNAPVVDNRLKYLESKRGTGKTAEDLSNQWAMNSQYGEILAQKYNAIMSHVPDESLIEKYKDRTYGILGQDIRVKGK